jgi:hypothetical protein
MAQKTTITPCEFTDVIAKEDELNTTTSEDLFDGAKTIYGISLDNSANAQVVYYKFYNALEADPSSDVPDLKLRVATSTKTDIWIADGISFSTGFSARCVTGADDTATTGPGTPGPGYFIGS